MRAFRAAALTAAGFCLGGAAVEADRVEYVLTPALKDGVVTSLDVEMRFRGDSDGETVIDFPDKWAGSKELWRNIEDVVIRLPASVTGERWKPLLRHSPGEEISVRYRVTSAYNEDPGLSYEKARPIVRPDWFFFHGEGVFATVAGREAAPAGFRWGKLPPGWTVASDLDHLAARPGTVKDVVESVALGGADLTIVERRLAGAPLRVALRGEWSFEPEALGEAVVRIVAAEYDYWGDPGRPYLIAMAPLGRIASGLSFTGTGRSDGFSIASTSAFELGDALRFLAHETNHSWIPRALGAMPAEREAVDYWLAEGFSDFLAGRMLVRAGLWRLDQFAAEKNDVLLRYWTSTARSAGAEEIADKFWSDDAARQISYDRGHLLAAMLDARIRAATGGRKTMDDVLRAQRDMAKRSDRLASALFPEALKAVAGLDIGAELRRYTVAGAPFELPPDVFGDCARLDKVKRREFHRGFDVDATMAANSVIAGVVPDGPAYAAGMRDGMTLLGRDSGKVGDSSVEIGYRVRDAAGERVIRYLPQGKKEVTVQRMALTVSGPAQEKKCRELLGGGR